MHSQNALIEVRGRRGPAPASRLDCTHPEFYEEEGILGTLAVKLLQTSLLFWEFVVNLANVHRFQQGVAVGVICLSDVYK